MRLIDADELVEHAWRDKLDSRELIAQMIENAPTVKEIPTKIPISVFEKLISQEPKTGHWISVNTGKQSHTKDGMIVESVKCSECDEWLTASDEYACNGNYCPNCGARMEKLDD